MTRSLELTVQSDGIIRIGPVSLLTVQDFEMAGSGGLGVWLQVVEGLHRGLSDFIHRVVVHRREEAILGWRNWLREDPLVHFYKWLRPDLVPPAPFFQCKPHLTPGGFGFLLIQPGLMKNSERPGFPSFAVLGKGIPALRNSMKNSRGGYLCCLRLLCPG